MGNRLFISVCISALLFTGIGYSGDKEKDKPTRFNFTTIKDTTFILTQSDLRGKLFKKMEVLKGKVIPGRQFGVKGSGRLSLLVCGEEIGVFLKKGKPTISINGRERPLKVSVAGCKPETIPLKNRQRFVLAFPYADLKDEKNPRMCYRSGSIMKGILGRSRVSLYDDNCDGRIVRGHDSIQINSSPVFAPLGRLIPGPEGVLQMDSLSEDGTEMKTSPYTGATGKIEFKIENLGKGLEAHLAFKGNTTHCNFAGKIGRQPLTVAEDEYSFQYGLLIDGRSKKIIAGIIPRSMNPFKVRAGQTTTVKFGGPLRFDFKANVVSGVLHLDPNSIKIFGSNGEEYLGYETQGAPRVSVIVEGQKKPAGSVETDDKGAFKKFEKDMPRFNGKIPKGDGEVQITASVKGLGKLSGTFKRKF